ncbi:MAG: thiamine phosphate synthase [Nitrospinae bacterium]|nr:thiamine phosphate synthase [Nitrospinota bacterium]
MPLHSLPYRLCLITDPAYLPEGSFEEKMSEALSGGVDMVQYRNITGTREEKMAQARILRRITGQWGAALIINKEMDIAEAVQADGVQLGKGSLSVSEVRSRLGKDFLIGASVHNAGEIEEAESAGADFLILSPLFAPGSKETNLPSLGPVKFSALCRAAKSPIFALGGITPENAAIAFECGAHGLASISGILGAPCVYEAAGRMKNMNSNIQNHRAGF